MDKLDVKLWTLAAKGQIVPDRSLLKTPEQIKAIQESADLNTAVLDHVAAHIREGMSTEEIDRLVYDLSLIHILFFLFPFGIRGRPPHDQLWLILYMVSTDGRGL